VPMPDNAKMGNASMEFVVPRPCAQIAKLAICRAMGRVHPSPQEARTDSARPSTKRVMVSAYAKKSMVKAALPIQNASRKIAWTAFVAAPRAKHLAKRVTSPEMSVFARMFPRDKTIPLAQDPTSRAMEMANAKKNWGKHVAHQRNASSANASMEFAVILIAQKPAKRVTSRIRSDCVHSSQKTTRIQ
jgi:hypothetical protein